MSKFNFGKFPEIEGWFWVRAVGDKTPLPYYAIKQNDRWLFSNGSEKQCINDFEGIEFCRMEVPE